MPRRLKMIPGAIGRCDMPEIERSSGREPTREEIDGTDGPVLLEFGASWCPYCRALAPELARLLREYTGVRHIKVEDGPGRPLLVTWLLPQTVGRRRAVRCQVTEGPRERATHAGDRVDPP